MPENFANFLYFALQLTIVTVSFFMLLSLAMEVYLISANCWKSATTGETFWYTVQHLSPTTMHRMNGHEMSKETEYLLGRTRVSTSTFPLFYTVIKIESKNC